MTIEDEVAELRRELRYVKDRAEILDCVANVARGMIATMSS